MTEQLYFPFIHLMDREVCGSIYGSVRPLPDEYKRNICIDWYPDTQESIQITQTSLFDERV